MTKPSKVVILCGGQGTRLHEETEFKPKPMLEIGGRPILWHIMKTYAHFGFADFVLCLGYKGDVIRDYFLNYDWFRHDLTITLGRTRTIQIHNRREEDRDWRVTLVETGEDSMTGDRIRIAARYIDTPTFLLTYGDGVANVNIRDLVAFHKSHRKMGTVTGVRPSSRFGELKVKEGKAVQFSEKPQITEGYINGGFFVFQRKFLSYLSKEPGCILEKEPLVRLAEKGNLMVYPHNGFWQCMDTYRDYKLLNELWSTGRAHWKIWR
ncbi:MAG: glucose-1-phosphate cytidylyltransferase [Elusimicrobia bacterium]|nr:glucose-1-phosphate cytidylyltransferase [Elusimicrobiota bacterium]